LEVDTDTDADADADKTHPENTGKSDPVVTEEIIDHALGEDHATDTPTDVARTRRHVRLPKSPRLQALIVGWFVIIAFTGVAGWQGWQVYQAHRVSQGRATLLEAGRQGALNLTTIDWQHADADVQRIADSATGTFYDDFSKQSKPFIEAVTQAQSTSVGTITSAGLESATPTDAHVLVAVSVSVANSSGPERNPRSWRMRISVVKVGDDAKVSNVEFVP
jgi:Mce-associated membrane protein